jgi:beta-lactamase regulating signal transducer with metallopeptidase domain
MTTLFSIGITNALLATVLALVVWCVTRVLRQPPLVQLLWVLVLVKLVTPPLISIPWRFEQAATNETVVAQLTTGATSRDNSELANEHATFAEAPSIPIPKRVAFADGNGEIFTEIESAGVTSTPAPFNWTLALTTIWLTGTLAWILIAAVRLTRFHRALRNTVECSDDVQRCASAVARKLGMYRQFRLRMTDARLSPLVWPIGRPTIVVSRPLLAELSHEEIKTLLAHELAHLRRRDHWLRWFELFVTAIYWWHPVVGWTRRMISRAEEQACDAWVVWAFPDAAKRYATALFKTMQMVSDHRSAAPLVASRLGSSGNIKHRIEDIMNATWNCRLSLSALTMLMLIALTILPLSVRAVSAAAEKDNTAKAETADNNDDSKAATAAEPNQDAAKLPAELQEKLGLANADPYRIAPGHIIHVIVVNAFPEQPIADDFFVEPSGSVPLGPVYGRVKVGGLTLEEAEKAIATHLSKMLQGPQVQVTIGDWRNKAAQVSSNNPLVERNAPARDPLLNERVSPQEIDALREHVEFLTEQFKKQDALFQTGSRGGSSEKRTITAYELATAQCELASAEGRRNEAIAFAEQAAKSSDEALKSTTASYEAGRVPLDLLLKTARYAAESKRRLLRLRKPQPSATTGETQRASSGDIRPQHDALQAVADEPSSVRYWNKVVENKKRRYERLETLAKANEISATELDKAKLDYELSVAQYEHAKRNLRYAQLQVELAETDYQQALDTNKVSPRSIPELEVRKLRIKVDMAKVRLSDVE